MFDETRNINRLLGKLNDADFRYLTARASLVRLPVRTVIYNQGEEIQSVYFPLDNVLSSIVLMRDGSMAEVCMIGRDGCSGYSLIAGTGGSPTRLVQQVEGDCLKVPAAAFIQLLVDSPDLHALINKYAMTVLNQSSQLAACNVRHMIRERMARWLLMTGDRVRGNDFFLTQESLSIMLGVRRQSVNQAGSSLQREGLIRYSRGMVTILDRERLMSAACECYLSIRDSYNAIMGKD